MVDQLLLLLQALFLLILFLFVWWVIRASRKDLRYLSESIPGVSGEYGEAARSPAGQLVISRSRSLDAGASFPLGVSAVTIGRSGDNVIALGNDEYTSAQHARIEPRPDGLWVVDLGSTNGTYLNGQQIGDRERLTEGDLLRVGETELRLER